MSLEELLELAEGTRPATGKKDVVSAESTQADGEPDTGVEPDDSIPPAAELHMRTSVLNSLSMARSALQVLGHGEDYKEVCDLLGELTGDLANEWSEGGPIAAVRALADQGVNEEADHRAQERYEKAKSTLGPAFEIDDEEDRVGVVDPDAFDKALNDQIAAAEVGAANNNSGGMDFFSDPHSDTEE